MRPIVALIGPHEIVADHMQESDCLPVGGLAGVEQFQDIAGGGGVLGLNQIHKEFLSFQWPEGRSKCHFAGARSEEHTSELQSLMRISYAVFCLKKKNTKTSYN